MIQVYKSGNTNFNANGDKVIFPISCMLQMELNGPWELELEHLIDAEDTWKLIVEEAVLSVPTPTSKKQLYRIYNTEKNDSSVTAYARPIFMDAAHEVFLADKKITVKNGQAALNAMLEQTPYSGRSNILNTASAHYVRRNLLEAIAGEDENSFVNQWGGEILYDNYCIHVNERAGGDYGTTIRTGKNLIGLKEKIDMDKVITRIIPVAYKGYTLAGEKPWVDSPNVDRYAIVYTKEVKFEDVKLTEDANEGEVSFANVTELRKELVKRSQKMFAEGCDLPEISYDIDMAYLANTEEYNDVEAIERVGLGDEVHCRHKRLDITTSARAIKLSYNCLLKQTEKVTLGEFSYNYFKSVTSSVNKIKKVTDDNGNLMGESIRGTIDANLARLYAMADTAKRTGEKAILFEDDRDPSSDTYGAMAIGTTGFLIAGEKTQDGRSWDWKTFGTAKGFHAEHLIAGYLTSRNWEEDEQGFRLNLDEGTINAKNLKLDTDGRLELRKARISDAELLVTDTNGDILFGANENGVGLGWNGQAMQFLEGEGTIFINTKTETYGKFSFNYGVDAISTSVDGEGVKLASGGTGMEKGRISVFESDEKSGIGIAAAKDKTVSIGIATDSSNSNYKTMMSFDSPDEPPMIANTWSGTLTCGNQTATVKNGLIVSVT